ncbi:MAG: type II toxin-antitoxin system prevent-host-death family antitoxin [Myxococcota bacterium]
MSRRTPYSLRDAKARLSELLDRAARGEEVEIVRAGAEPGRFRILAIEVDAPLCAPGALRGAFALPEHFDDADPKVQALFEGATEAPGPDDA